MGTVEFVTLASLRAAQLMKGCTPRVHSGHKNMVTAQMEVASGAIVRLPPVVPDKVGP